MKPRHLFFSIEGVDGVGKTTCIAAANRLRPALFTMFKSPPEEIDRFRKVYDAEGVPLEARFLFYLSANAYQTKDIAEATKRNAACCDRFVLSTIAYHNVFAGTGMFNSFFPLLGELGIMVPDHTIILTADEAARFQRVRQRSDSLNTKRDYNMELTSAVQNELLKLASGGIYPSESDVIDTSRIGIERIAKGIIGIIEQKIRGWLHA